VLDGAERGRGTARKYSNRLDRSRPIAGYLPILKGDPPMAEVITRMRPDLT